MIIEDKVHVGFSGGMENIAEQIADCEALPQLWRVMLTYFRGLGFHGQCYLAFGSSEPGAAIGTDVQPFHHGFPSQQVDAYLAADFARLDIVPRQALAQGKPLRWREAWAGSETSPEERGFMELMREVELGDGIALPCYGPMGRNGVVSIGRMQPDVRDDEQCVRVMHMMAQAAHLRICALTVENVPGKPLSAREREILEWVARGKSNSVIAEILNISSGTVDTYLRRIYEKLGVSDRTSAAVRGVGMGLIAA